MTSNHHAPYDLGHTRATMDGAEGSETARLSRAQKPVLSSDCSLQLDCTKLESLVIADQHAAVNTFSGGADDWGEVVTRYPYGNVGMDHLLSREKCVFLFGFLCLAEKEDP